MSIMDSHPSGGRGNAAGQALYDQTTSDNPSTSHSHQFVDSSGYPFRTPSDKMVDSQPAPLSSSTTASQHQSLSRPSSGSAPEWSSGVQSTTRRPYNPTLETARDLPPPTYPSPTSTPAHHVGFDNTSTTTTSSTASRRSSAQHVPPEFAPSTAVSTTSVGPVSQPSGQGTYVYHGGDDTSLAMIAAIDCGLDVRPFYGDPRQTRGSEDVRGSYYPPGPPPPPTQYSVGAILPSHFPHISSTLHHNQASVGGPARRVSSFADGRMLYNTNPPVSDPTTRTTYSGLPMNTYPPQNHTHESAPAPPQAWPHATIDSVRDSVSPYTRPRPGELGGSGRNNCTLPNSTSLNSTMRSGPAGAANMPGGMQYNAQGRPLAYMCNTCLRAFDRPSALQIHERSHTGERPFPCPWNGCVKRFTTHVSITRNVSQTNVGGNDVLLDSQSY
ncbi:hypothetical protein CROQUDRAFT_61365 [Cronartium quercuum f. sp. fusiforme G11]|uniref:C2H2-type domain-containing protein n=1 Tax=Cronartium quercuum f. sp. fusiforme G11 TaxID=708437 RepID=A0A9P6TEH2_9BASI|nr:hypothetical protein CROQUDRAFT_61365 [Cronartium quercuum f. sp. fusiforme G11]